MGYVEKRVNCSDRVDGQLGILRGQRRQSASTAVSLPSSGQRASGNPRSKENTQLNRRRGHSRRGNTQCLTKIGAATDEVKGKLLIETQLKPCITDFVSYFLLLSTYIKLM